MEIVCLGLSHHTAPIEVRERFAIPDADLPTTAAELRSTPRITACMTVMP